MSLVHDSKEVPSDAAKRSPGMDNPLITTIAVSLAGVVVMVCIGILFTRFLHRDFLGAQTRLIHECKKNPNINPELCVPILEARAVDGQPPPRAYRDRKLQRGFKITKIDDELRILDTPS